MEITKPAMPVSSYIKHHTALVCHSEWVMTDRVMPSHKTIKNGQQHG